MRGFDSSRSETWGFLFDYNIGMTDFSMGTLDAQDDFSITECCHSHL